MLVFLCVPKMGEIYTYPWKKEPAGKEKLKNCKEKGHG